MSNGHLYYKALDVPNNHLYGGRIRALIVHWVCYGRSDEQMLKTAVSGLLPHVHVEHPAKSPWRDEQRFSLCFRTSLDPAYGRDIPGLKIPSAELLVECLDSTHELEHVMVLRNALDSFRDLQNSRFAPADTPTWDAPTWTPF